MAMTQAEKQSRSYYRKQVPEFQAEYAAGKSVATPNEFYEAYNNMLRDKYPAYNVALNSGTIEAFAEIIADKPAQKGKYPVEDLYLAIKQMEREYKLNK